MNKRHSIVCALLFTVTLCSAQTPRQPDTFKVFWEKFKTAVIKSDKETVASLSRFPIKMSFGKTSIKNKAQLLRRYREVFNEQTNAAQCFSKKDPEKEAESARFSIACPDEAGNEVVVYSFAPTKTGWKFTGLDNLNE